MRERVYLAGPMTGRPYFNFPAFDAAVADLSARGYDVVPPADLGDDAIRAVALSSTTGDLDDLKGRTSKTWGDFLSADVKLIADDGIEAVVVLPGWETSRGARLETFVAKLNGLPVWHYGNEDPLLEVAAIALSGAHAGVATNGEVRVVDPNTGGEKGRKFSQLGALDPTALLTLGEVAGFGVQKYARFNYVKGFDWSLAFDALMRHALLFWSGEDLDAESGLPHIAHAAWQCLCLLTFSQRDRGTDDRLSAE